MLQGGKLEATEMKELRVTRRAILESAAVAGCASIVGGDAMAREPETMSRFWLGEDGALREDKRSLTAWGAPSAL